MSTPLLLSLFVLTAGGAAAGETVLDVPAAGAGGWLVRADAAQQIDRYRATSPLVERARLGGSSSPVPLDRFLAPGAGEPGEITNTSPCTIPATPSDLCPTYRTIKTVCPSGCDYSDIQTALNSVASQTTIQVRRRAVAYQPYTVGNLQLNRRQVNLEAENVIDREWIVRLSTPATGAGLTITADTVCVRGFRIDHRSSAPAILVSGTAAAPRTAVKIARNHIDATGASSAIGIQLIGTNGTTVVENRLIGDNDSMGIHFEGDLGNKNNLVNSNVISGFGRGIVLNAGTFASYNQPMTFNTIALNHIRGAGDGIFAWSMTLTGIGSANVSDNLYFGNRITDPAGSDASGVFLVGTQRDRVCQQTISGPWLGVALDGSGFTPSSDTNTVADSFVRAGHWAIAVGPDSKNGRFLNNNLATSRTADSKNAAWAFVQNGASHTISGGEGHGNDCWMYFDMTPTPLLTLTVDPREIDNNFEGCWD